VSAPNTNPIASRAFSRLIITLMHFSLHAHEGSRAMLPGGLGLRLAYLPGNALCSIHILFDI
jgi:hypothetical protein